jgi:hypothetical protein
VRGLPGRKARGHTIELGPGPGAGVEQETFTCCHCNGVTIIEHRAKPEDLGRYCLSCDAMTCVRCASFQGCVPFMRRIDESVRRGAMLAAMR